MNSEDHYCSCCKAADRRECCEKKGGVESFKTTYKGQAILDYHNNHAEQQIRPDVIFRKITYGNRSYNGAENHSVIMSILQTVKLNGIDPIGAIEKILLKSPQNPLAKAFSP